MKSLMVLINLIRIVQIPVEMVVAKLLASQKRAIFALAVELSKLVLRLGIWQGSGWRPVPRQFSVPLDRHSETSFSPSNDGDAEINKLDRKMADLEAQLKESKSNDPLLRYIKGHKSDVYTSNPQKTFQPCSDWKSWTREFVHLARPSAYGKFKVAIDGLL
jgi:hypothetical protein